MKSQKELEQLLEVKINEYNHKDNTQTQNDIIYGQIILLRWILEKNKL